MEEEGAAGGETRALHKEERIQYLYFFSESSDKFRNAGGKLASLSTGRPAPPLYI